MPLLAREQSGGPSGDAETETLIPVLANGAGEANGAGIGQPGDPSFALDSTGAMAVCAFDARQSDVLYGDLAGLLDTDGHTLAVAQTLRAETGRQQIESNYVAVFDPNQITHPENRCQPKPGLSHPLPAQANAPVFGRGTAVRRLTPQECERLQAFPDDSTLIPYRGKPAQDGPRYRALGNSMCVNVMLWLGRRIQAVMAPFTTCACGRTFTSAEWDVLPAIGTQKIPADWSECDCRSPNGEHKPGCAGRGYVLVMKNCGCGSTLARESDASAPTNN